MAAHQEIRRLTVSCGPKRRQIRTRDCRTTAWHATIKAPYLPSKNWFFIFFILYIDDRKIDASSQNISRNKTETSIKECELFLTSHEPLPPSTLPPSSDRISKNIVSGLKVVHFAHLCATYIGRT
jgi:hypothetical protein